MSALAQLESILGRPRNPVAAVPWEDSLQEIGIRFPSDYRELIDTYGQISINNELHITGPTVQAGQPGAPTGFKGFRYATADPYGFCGYLASCYADGDYDECPYPVFPAPGGILKWANNSESDHLFWLTEGDDPDSWPIVIVYRADFEWDRFNGSATEFLLQLLTGEYERSSDLVGREPGARAPLWTFRGDWSGWA
jgi:hypothetical protein